MYKQLLDPHFILSALFMLLVGIGWLIGRMNTIEALPILAVSAGIGIGSALTLRGVQTGVPLKMSDTSASLPAVSLPEKTGG